MSTGNALNAWDTGTTQSLTLMEDLPAKTAETTGDTAHGVPGTSTGDLTSVSNAKKGLSMTLFLEIVSVNADDSNLSLSEQNQDLSSLNKTHALTFVLLAGSTTHLIGSALALISHSVKVRLSSQTKYWQFVTLARKAIRPSQMVFALTLVRLTKYTMTQYLADAHLAGQDSTKIRMESARIVTAL